MRGAESRKEKSALEGTMLSKRYLSEQLLMWGLEGTNLQGGKRAGKWKKRDIGRIFCGKKEGGPKKEDRLIIEKKRGLGDGRTSGVPTAKESPHRREENNSSGAKTSEDTRRYKERLTARGERKRE